MTCKEAYDAWEIPERELGEGLGIEEVFTAGWDAAVEEYKELIDKGKELKTFEGQFENRMKAMGRIGL